MNNEEKEYIKLTPFKMQVLQSFPFIDADFDALTNYELLCKVVDYLNKTIDNVDVLHDEVEEYINKFNELKSYVDNYFDNLDVQEEINNKLDEMAESGVLTGLIKDYVDPIYEAYEQEINENIVNFKEEVNSDIDDQNTEISNFKTLINGQVQHIDEKVTNATSGSPKGVYGTLSDLQTADPDHDYTYVVLADGYWYYYDSTLGNWTQGGIYQTAVNPIDVTIQPKNSNYYPGIWIKGKYINSSGIITDYSTIENVGYCEIPIQENFDNIITNAITGAAGYIAFYDDNDDVISCTNYNNKDTKTISIPATSVYVRITNLFMDPNPNKYETNPVVQINNGLFTFELNTYNDINDILNDSSNNEHYLKKDWIRSYYINEDGEVTQYANTNVGYIEIPYNSNWKEIITNAVSGNDGRIAFYDNSDNVISLTSYNEIGIKKFIIPENTKIIKVSNVYAGATRHEENPYIQINNGLFTFELNIQNEINDINNKFISLKNKKLSILGDSISTFTGLIPEGANSQYPDQDVLTFNDTWMGMLLNKTGMVLEELNSYGASRITNTGSITPFVDNSRINNLGTPDIIIVFGGTNDMYQNGTYLGDLPNIYNTPLSSYDKTTFKSAYLYLLTKIKETYPNALIYSCGIIDYTRSTSSVYFKNSHDMSKQIVNEAIKECSDIAGVKYIDLLKCGITYYNFANYSDDQIHPNKAGMELISNYIYKNL